MMISEKSSGEESIVINRYDLPLAYVRDFRREPVEKARDESMIQFQAPKSFNLANWEPTLRTWLEKIGLYWELSAAQMVKKLVPL